MKYEFVIVDDDHFKGAKAELSPIEIMIMRDALSEYIINADIHMLNRKIAERMVQLMWEEEEKL